MYEAFLVLLLIWCTESAPVQSSTARNLIKSVLLSAVGALLTIRAFLFLRPLI